LCDRVILMRRGHRGISKSLDRPLCAGKEGSGRSSLRPESEDQRRRFLRRGRARAGRGADGRPAHRAHQLRRARDGRGRGLRALLLHGQPRAAVPSLDGVRRAPSGPCGGSRNRRVLLRRAGFEARHILRRRDHQAARRAR
jgi:hypothetical protein